MQEETTIGFIGAGNMAAALIGVEASLAGAAGSGVQPASTPAIRDTVIR